MIDVVRLIALGVLLAVFFIGMAKFLSLVGASP